VTSDDDARIEKLKREIDALRQQQEIDQLKNEVGLLKSANAKKGGCGCLGVLFVVGIIIILIALI
jgi:cytochrome c biogenesis protein ResB